MGLKNNELNQDKSQLSPQFSCSSWLSEALNDQCWAVAEAGTQTICSVAVVTQGLSRDQQD